MVEAKVDRDLNIVKWVLIFMIIATGIVAFFTLPLFETSESPQIIDRDTFIELCEGDGHARSVCELLWGRGGR